MKQASIVLASGLLLAGILNGCLTGGSDADDGKETAGLQWTHRNGIPAAGWWNAILHADNQFVAVGGAILTSPDGTTWTTRWSSLEQFAYAAAWSGTQIIAVGSDGLILGSQDGVTWTPRSSGTTATLRSVAWSGSRFLALGPEDSVLTSTDGIAWTKHFMGTSAYPFSIAWSGTQFVAVDDDSIPTVHTSPDGVTWTAHPLDLGVEASLRSLACSNAQCVLVGYSGSVWTSANGTSWASKASGTERDLQAVTWSGSKFVAVGEGIILTSVNGNSWTARLDETSPGEGDLNLYMVAAGSGKYVAAGFDALLTSTDGATWAIVSPENQDNLRAAAWSGSLFAAIGIEGTLMTSPDAITWTQGARITDYFGLFSITWGGNKFVAGGINAVYTSPNGINWTKRPLDTENTNIYSIAWSGSRFVAVGSDGFQGAILTSASGSTWTVRESGLEEILSSVAWSGTRFVAVGNNGTILTSPDGTTWTPRAYGADGHQLNAVIWADSQFVAVGGQGVILTSPTGINWTVRAAPQELGTARFQSVAWSGSRFVAVGDGRIFTSPDGATWTPILAPPDLLNSVIWGGKKFVAVGYQGAILTSP
jgi:hypothetical protein